VRVLFLDIDGVLNNDAWFRRRIEARPDVRHNEDKLDPDAIKLLNKVIEQTGCKVVISSSWRKLFELDALREILRDQNGFVGDIIDRTPIIWRQVQRGEEVQMWLREYARKLSAGEVTEPIEGIACIDDDSDFDGMFDWLVKTQWDLGIQPEHVEQVVATMKKQPWTPNEETSPEND
jgi:hypothetical protein